MKNAADKLYAIKPQPIALKRVSCDAMRLDSTRRGMTFGMRNERVATF